MNYTLHQLQIFMEVIKFQSITKAAEEMHMTQPALSIQLKNFQQQFDIPLIEIIGKRLYITDFGKSIAVIAKKMMLEAEALQYKTKAYRGLLTGKLKISSASTGKYVIPYFLADFLKSYPGIDLTLDVSNKATVVNHLKENTVDFALVSVVPEEIKVKEVILLENKLYLVGNTPKLDKKKPLIYREDGSATRMAMDLYFGNIHDRRSLKLTSNEAVKQAVIAGLGYSILPLIGIKNELAAQQLFIIPAKKLPIITNWRLVWLENKQLSPIAQAFLHYISSEKQAIIQRQFEWYL